MIDLEDICEMLPSLYGTGWEYAVAGKQTYEIDGDGTRWAPIIGTERYNSDAFIVVRRTQKVESSKPNVEES